MKFTLLITAFLATALAAPLPSSNNALSSGDVLVARTMTGTGKSMLQAGKAAFHKTGDGRSRTQAVKDTYHANKADALINKSNKMASKLTVNNGGVNTINDKKYTKLNTKIMGHQNKVSPVGKNAHNAAKQQAQVKADAKTQAAAQAKANAQYQPASWGPPASGGSGPILPVAAPRPPMPPAPAPAPLQGITVV